ncbi:MAG: hypothetical protein DRQ40_07745 [Gammaproteobacteria bacterium]|nr:MAG: hypothetical protein DRQ40_07745 [Gammaproteobacteria bacterium]
MGEEILVEVEKKATCTARLVLETEAGTLYGIRMELDEPPSSVDIMDEKAYKSFAVGDGIKAKFVLTKFGDDSEPVKP